MKRSIGHVCRRRVPVQVATDRQQLEHCISDPSCVAVFCVHESYSVSSITSGTGASCDCALGLDRCQAIAIRFLSNNSQSVSRYSPVVGCYRTRTMWTWGCGSCAEKMRPDWDWDPPSLQNSRTDQTEAPRGSPRDPTEFPPAWRIPLRPSRSTKKLIALHGTDQPPPTPLARSAACVRAYPYRDGRGGVEEFELVAYRLQKTRGLTASPPFPSSPLRVLLYTRGRALDPCLLPRLTPSSSVPSHPLTRIPLGYSPLPFKNAPLPTGGYHPPINPSSIAR